LVRVSVEGAGFVTGFWTEASFAAGSVLLTMPEFSGFLFVVSALSLSWLMLFDFRPFDFLL
jgi:hypothetical protein